LRRVGRLGLADFLFDHVSLRSSCSRSPPSLSLFFYAPATTAIYTLSLHDALPISAAGDDGAPAHSRAAGGAASPSGESRAGRTRDRKSTRLNSSHGSSSYAVFCLKKKGSLPRHERERSGREAAVAGSTD